VDQSRYPSSIIRVIPSLSRAERRKTAEGERGKGSRGSGGKGGGDGESATTCTWVCYGVRRTTGGGTLAPAEVHPI